MVEPTGNRKRQKIVDKSHFGAICERLRDEGKKVVLCHGVFDLLHPGHIIHLDQAASLGDVLVVSVTSAPYVNKGPGRPYFSDEHRMTSLAALECVDFVVLSEQATALEIIEIVRPDVYVKGKEYAEAKNDVTANIDKEIEQTRRCGGDVHYTEGDVFSSTRLLNRHFDVLPPGVREFAEELTGRIRFDEVRRFVEAMASLKVLVVGDIIIDEYVMCQTMGLTSKDRAISVRYDGENRFLGGSLAIARHLAGFSQNVTATGILGGESHIHTLMLNELSREMYLDLVFDADYRTIVKRRYVERHGIRNEYEKMFSINYFPDERTADGEKRERYLEKLRRTVADYDLVVLCDFGHGAIDQQVMEIVQEKARFLAVNCQTNSANYGMNLITKYKKADTFTIDERELRLAMADPRGAEGALLTRLSQQLGARQGWVTLGSKGSVAVDREERRFVHPALTLTVLDTVGAGDAFYALSSMSAYLEAPVEIGSLLGNIAGSIASNYLGNSQSVRKGDLLKFVSTVLNI
ncbi:PfkB family carbohydrate kinase [Heliomicrobium gestii]|uniref:PfkB family carbohydrate kinase n=1 Tax=Heliomicrobium gestii TaxID=2699 RepID=UPI001F198D24|nr:PfkB family carbohydrate kinase [Heliomicrobium gestii]MBM7866684.1 rfaE bifunctional protein nucleotidyltransferase chain/domain [Heliomicrobium gestii]